MLPLFRPALAARLLAVGLVVLFNVAVPVAAAEDGPGLGGSTALTRDTVLPFSPEASGRYEGAVFLQNVGSIPLVINFDTNLPLGLRAEPLIEMPFRLDVGDTANVPVAIESTSGLVTGLYDCLISFSGSLEGPLPPGTTFLPGFSASFRANVIGGTPGVVTVRAINSNNEKPAFGEISLYYKNDDGGITLLRRKEASQITETVPPGKYVAKFSIAGLISQDLEFEIAEGEVKTVDIRVAGVNILAVSAQPRGGPTDVGAAQLSMVVANNLRRFVGPVIFAVDVKRDGELVENFKISELAELPEKVTEQQSTYIPQDGFTAGRWTFEFSLTTPEYTVRAADVPFINVPRRIGGLPVPLATVLIMFGVLAVVFGAYYLWLVARRRDDEDEE
jgi:hypothetical protein